MQLPKIQMQSELAKIGMQTENAKLHIKQPKASLTIEQPLGKQTIRSKQAKLTIDQTKAWEDMNLHSVIRNREIFSQKSLEKVKEITANKAREGRELMQIENKNNTIASQAKQRSSRGMKQLGIKFIPRPFSVDISYIPSSLDIHYEPISPKIQAHFNKPIVEYEKGNVDIYMRQLPSLSIDVIYS